MYTVISAKHSVISVAEVFIFHSGTFVKVFRLRRFTLEFDKFSAQGGAHVAVLEVQATTWLHGVLCHVSRVHMLHFCLIPVWVNKFNHKS